MSRSVESLMKQYDSLRARYSERDVEYEMNYYAFTGEYDRIYASYASDALTLNRKGSDTQIQKWNLIRPIVRTHQLLLAQMPTIEVPPPVLGDEMAALKADKTEKILYAWWDEIHMKRKHSEQGFHLALNEAVVWQVVWDDEREMPVAYVRSPGECYPVMKRGGDEVSYCFFRWEEDAEELAERYPAIKPLLTRNNRGSYSASNVEVIEYVDETERHMIIGGESRSLVPGWGGEHKLGCTPIVLVTALNIPGVLFPPTTVSQMIPMNDHINRFQTKLGRALEEVLYGHHVIEGEGANGVPINTGPGSVIRLDGPNLRYHYDQPQSPPAQAFAEIDMANRHMRNLGNWPETASGEMDSAIITGKAITRLQGVMAAQAAETMGNMADAGARVNSIALKMMQTYRPKKKYTLYAKDPLSTTSSPGRPSNFAIDFIPSEDIQDYTVNALRYSPFGTDFAQSLQIGMQLVSAELWPKSKLINLIPGSSDAEGLMAEIRAERREKAQEEADLQVEMQTRIMQAQAQIQQQQMQQQQAASAPSMGGTEAQGASAPVSGNAPTPPGGLPPSQPQSAGGEMIGGNAMLMPGGRPQVLGMGEPLTGSAENFPLPYTPLKPFGPAVGALTGEQGGGGQPPTGETASEAMPGRTMVTADEVVQALSEAANRKGEKATDKLQGEVYLMGELATRGETDGKIELGITVKADQQILTTALPQYASQGLLVFRNVGYANAQEAQASGAVQIFGPETEGE